MAWRKANGYPPVESVAVDSEFIVMTPDLERDFLMFRNREMPSTGALVEGNALSDYYWCMITTTTGDQRKDICGISCYLFSDINYNKFIQWVIMLLDMTENERYNYLRLEYWQIGMQWLIITTHYDIMLILCSIYQGTADNLQVCMTVKTN